MSLISVTLLILCILLILSKRIMDVDEEEVLEMRQKQQKAWMRQNVLSKRLEMEMGDKVKVSKKLDTELMLKQAGFEMDYFTFLLYRVSLTVIVGVMILVATRSIMITALFVGMAYVLPYEIVHKMANARLDKLEKQLGSAMNMIIGRYETLGDFKESIIQAAHDLEGQEPIHSEFRRTIYEMNLGVDPAEAVSAMADRTGNKYFKRFAIYYRIASDVGTVDSRKTLLMTALNQYEENKEIKRQLKSSLRDPVASAYIMLGSVPIIMIISSFMTDGYWDIMLNTLPGKIGLTFIIGTMIGTFWFINSKVSAPVDDFGEDKKKRRGGIR